MSGYLKIGGVTVKPPQKFNVGIQTIDADSSGRNASGKMVRNTIADKIKLDCEWGPLSDSEASLLLNAVNKTFFTVTYPDPKDGIVTKTFYVGDRSTPSYSWNSLFSQIKWEGLSMNFIEQ